MTITCPNCGTSYEIDAATFPAAGRKVRCARCREIWHAERNLSPTSAQEILPPEAAPADAFAHAPDPAAEPAPRGARIVEDGPGEDGQVGDGRGEDAADKVAPATGRDVEQAARAREAARRAARLRRRAGRAGRSGLGPFEAALVGAVLAGAAAAVYYREDVVRALPSAAALYELVGLPVNLRGLEFANLSYRRDFEDGIPVLILEGEIVNIRNEPLPVPAIRFGLRGRSGEEIYAWSVEPRQKVIEPAAVMPFRTRLASPPRAADTVQMRFMERGRRIVEAQP
ncbi:putative Zn finger-like uncharacterized protein [Tepidamorphus gemmatus]|uniref:Putative Zn finger-like uncharacterized protein n=1 Tax=Tepidamorphus gemmatus TaxID=747076 RepID=A0A4R3MEB5_9HYPH|nr:zinc-ribbon domain-containing protein [Tepidamorphus gemmatus]TCT11821.1 putative Zn finger-like uncharacterized protein [Tepidamorphus gemmatus]